MTDIRTQKLLYHLTDLANLDSIFTHGLLPRSELSSFSDVADAEIILSRQQLGLESQVPFHFFARNPFDGRVQINNRDKQFVLITVTREFARANGWKVVPKHPLSGHDVQLLDYDQGIEAIDWQSMNERNYQIDDCRRVCMAECLSPAAVPASRFFSIFVADEGSEKKVRTLMDANSLSFYLNTSPHMFVGG